MPAVRELLAEATTRLAASGVGSARVDAELLLAHVLGVTRARLPLRDAVTPAEARDYDVALDRRAAREPLQHITGTAPFRHVELAVGPGVFVPRPETELLVDAVLPHLRGLDRPEVVDLCAGSGALAVAVADELPTAAVTAVERSPAALPWLRRNTAGTRVTVIAADVGDDDALRPLAGRVDAVVANPPYVPLASPVDPEVRADPPEAVFGGSDGLDVVATVIGRAATLLRPGGVLAVEHDDTHGTTVPALLRADGRWQAIEARSDLAGRPRYALARRGEAG
ncbi:release factor glutamine methyltransferase [Jatrophihabitans endophyticus]|uniref:Release factor glutamine methyltransferase n=1 Tax=Jatrophihabitans endophyticus TaxID=1206085 RepID=A0A1M5DKJ2_9ACTN|nr:peptide chain release factor N(5)-glutamine methyltransferase [Jatrophihabitans endophyticus]SHF67426.1 release factor glutamine methyltransferase [Jatrophihabitans endophyticus]